MKLPQWMSPVLTGASVALLLLSSCGPSTGTAAGSISGTISYSGALGGGRALSIALYKTYPPKGPPLASQLVQKYEMPYHYFFDGLEPGSYYVGALIDIDPSDTRYPGMLNAVRDPHGYVGNGKPVKLEQLQGAPGADIRLEDPR